jgi:uncharacterized protein YndB with AHSA1/START domain
MSAPELTLRRMIDGPVEAVFRAWTDPHTLALWWGPANFSTPVAEMDVRPGGAYRFVMRSPDGAQELSVGGTYREVEPPRRLVFSWRWEGGVPDAMESLVTVELHPHGERTELVLTHGGFTDDEAARPYGDGWTASLAKLVARFET